MKYTLTFAHHIETISSSVCVLSNLLPKTCGNEHVSDINIWTTVKVVVVFPFALVQNMILNNSWSTQFIHNSFLCLLIFGYWKSYHNQNRNDKNDFAKALLLSIRQYSFAFIKCNHGAAANHIASLRFRDSFAFNVLSSMIGDSQALVKMRSWCSRWLIQALHRFATNTTMCVLENGSPTPMKWNETN